MTQAGSIRFHQMKTKATTPERSLRAKAIKFKPANSSRSSGTYCIRIEGQRFTPMVEYQVLFRQLNATGIALKPLKWFQLPPNRLIMENDRIIGIVWTGKEERRRMGWATEFIEKYGVDILKS